MNKKLIITIGREYGSGGSEIAEKLAKRLAIPLYDKNILEMASSESGISQDYLESEDERLSNPFFEPYTPQDNVSGSLSERLFSSQSAVIKEKAEQGSCIIVGRCSDVVLKDFEDCYHFFIFAPRPERILRIMKVEAIEEDLAALSIIKKIDKQRRSYYQFYTEQKWGSATGKDLLLNSATIGIDGCVTLIIDFLRQKGYEIA